MGHQWKKAALILAAALALTACGSGSSTEGTTAQNTDTSASASSEAAVDSEAGSAEGSADAGQDADSAEGSAHEVIDMAGNTVMVPDKIERVVIDQIPILSTYMAYFEGSAPYIVGYCGSFKDTISETVLKNIAPELMESSETVYAQSDLNIEEIIKLQPDVILYNANNAEHAEILKASGIPSIGFATVGADTPADPTERYQQWLNLLEDVFNEPGKMDAFFETGDSIMSDVENRIAQIPEEERPTAMILFKLIDGVPQVAGKGVFGDFWLQHLGVQNVAQEAQGFAQVSFEQIYSWNPEVLFLNGPGLLNLTETDVLNNTVEDGQVYDTTLGMWNWFTPNPDAPLVLAWLACNTYPEAFADYPLEETIRSYYKDFYHYDITDEELEGMLHLR